MDVRQINESKRRLLQMQLVNYERNCQTCRADQRYGFQMLAQHTREQLETFDDPPSFRGLRDAR